MTETQKLRPPDVEKLKERLKKDQGCTQIYRIETVTPMFGGGVEAGVVDETMPIRATTIRGHLRFWWRMLYGFQYESIEHCFKDEEAIWGSTDKKSLIDVAVKIIYKGQKKCCGDFKEDQGKQRWRFHKPLPGYVLFPFKPDQIEPDQKEEKKKQIPDRAHYIENIIFDLSLTVPTSTVWKEKYGKKIQSTLWAWINFGGVGARTRRGCGALFCKDFSPQNVEQFSVDFIKCLPKNRRFFKAICVSSLPVDRKVSWKKLINRYQKFRQGVDIARNPGRDRQDRPGRSRWPEPESIREIVEQRDPRHQRNEEFADHPEHAFPRAALGLPIITHFQNQNDPQDTTLLPVFQGETKTRMASPLILKPLALQDHKAAVELVLALNCPLPDELKLKKGANEVLTVNGQVQAIKNPKFAQYQKSPLENCPQGDAVHACVDYIKSKIEETP